MAILDVRGFGTIVGNIAAAVQGNANRLLDYSIGSVLRAIAEAEAGLSLWLQGIILQVLATTRLETSQGSDVDTFINDWGMFRLGASLSAGQVTFSRFTPATAVVIPVGTQVRTSDGTQTFQVIADSTSGSFSSAANGYLLPATVTSVACTVQSINPGIAANVAANTVTVIVNSIIGIDFCNNTGPMSGGSDAETDQQAKARFPLYVASLAEGTIEAIQFAIESLKLGMQSTIIENINQDGSSHPGFLYITVDDGTGFPPPSTLNAAALAAGTARAGGVMWGVFAPKVLLANIAITIVTAPGFDHPTVVGIVSNAVTIFVNTLPLGETLAISQLAQIAYNASPGVINMAATINNLTTDLVATKINVVKINSLTVV
jgi:uncharacterized phage protein gp47/JayE